MTLKKMKVRDLRPHPKQSAFFDPPTDAKVQEPAHDIQDNGLRTPIEILPDGTVVCGHTRLAAVKALGWTTVDVVVREDLAERGEKAVHARMVEDNLHRRHMSKLEQARAYDWLREQLRLEPADEEVTRRLETLDELMSEIGLQGRNRNRYLAVLRTPRAVQDAFEARAVSLDQASRVAQLPAAVQKDLAAALEAGKDPRSVVKGYLPGDVKTKSAAPDERFEALLAALDRGLRDLDPDTVLLHVGRPRASRAVETMVRAIAFFEAAMPRLRRARNLSPARKSTPEARAEREPRG
jgi:ParB-like chromosome segregation protein Spo0J